MDKRTIMLPKGASAELHSEESLILIGGTGSGKTSFARSIEKINKNTLYISYVKEAEGVQPNRISSTARTIWNAVFSHQGGRALLYPQKSGGEETVLFWAQWAAQAPKDALIIVDEPELHMHKTALSRLWDAVEKSRPDLAFIYITNDFHFASSRKKALFLYVESYEGKGLWNWRFVEETDDQLISALRLELLGSQENILFVEGQERSHDTLLYKIIYPHRRVCPLGSCTEVEKRVRSFNDSPLFYGKEAYGIIDRDRKDNGEIAASQESGYVFVLRYAEVENIYADELLIKAMIRKYCDEKHRGDESAVSAMFEAWKNWAFKYFTEQKEYQIYLRLEYRLSTMDLLRTRDAKRGESVGAVLDENFPALRARMQEEYNYWNTCLDEILSLQDYGQLLELFNQKGFSHQLGQRDAFRIDNYHEKVRNLLENDRALLQALRQKLPAIG